jgi:hypothetical protein
MEGVVHARPTLEARKPIEALDQPLDSKRVGGPKGVTQAPTIPIPLDRVPIRPFIVFNHRHRGHRRIAELMDFSKIWRIINNDVPKASFVALAYP